MPAPTIADEWSLMKDIEKYLAQFDPQTCALLAEVASKLKPHSSEFESGWVAAYRELAGDHAGLSEQKASDLITSFLNLFVQHVADADLSGYFQAIEQAGREAASEGVPYGDLMMVIHQYEELTTPFLMEHYTDREQLRIVLSSLDRLYHAGIAIIASAYFQDTLGQLRESNEEVLRQKSRAEAVTNVSPDGILVCDAGQMVVSVNPAMEALSGYPAEQLLGRLCRYALGARDKEGTYLCDSICPFISRPAGDLAPADATLTRQDGEKIWVEARFGIMREPNGKITGVVHSFRDITERKNIERLRDELLSVATHELRTPITSVKGHAQLMLRRLRNKPEAESERRSLEIIDEQLDRMIGLINELLEMSRLQTGHLHLDLEPVDLQALATDVVERLQVTTDQHTLRQAGTGSRPVLADRFRIDQVLTNMVSNAIKYSPQGGDIDLLVEDLGIEVLVSVRDQGVGIPEEEQEHVFDQFYQVRSKQYGSTSGMGLGLYISEQIIKLHGGQIGVKSQPGCGSTFYFTIPTGLAASPATPSESGASRRSAM